MSERKLKSFAGHVLVGSMALSGFSLGAPMVFAQSQQPAPVQQGAAGDGQVEMDVVKALDGQTALANDWITAATTNGVVTLSGTVSSQDHIQLAQTAVQGVSGVTSVVNNLKVGDPSAQNTNGQPMGQDAAPADGSAQGDPNQQQDPNAQYQQQPQGQVSDNGQPQPYQPYGPPAGGQPGYAPNGQPGYGQPGYGPGAPPPGGGGNYGPQGPGGYQQQPAPRPSYADRVFSNTPLTIAPNTLLQLRTAESVDAKHAGIGQPIQFNVVRDVYVGQYLAIPRGTVAHGVVSDVKKAGALGGSPLIGIRLTAIDLGGQSIPVDSDSFHVKGPDKTGHTVGSAFGGALLGAFIGGGVGRGAGAAIGAGAGAIAGTAASAATPGPNAWIPSEALVDFHLLSPLTVGPLNPAEARQLANSLRPILQPRPQYYPGAYPPGYMPPPPPVVYYRPYYGVGGGYYWR